MSQRVWSVSLSLVLCFPFSGQEVRRPLSNGMNAPDSWEQGAARDEIRPKFGYEPQAGPAGTPALIISCQDAGGNGYWRKTFNVAPGQFYRFSALFQAVNVAMPRRSVLAEIEWQDE